LFFPCFFPSKVTIEPVAAAAHSNIGKVYQVQYTTGKSADAGSSDTEFIQFHGSKGSSHYYVLGSSFVKGETKQISLRVSENIGTFQRITLEAGGEDAWQTVGSVRVKPPTSYWRNFKTGFYLSDQPHPKGNYHFYYQKELYETLTVAEKKLRDGTTTPATRAPTPAVVNPTVDDNSNPDHKDTTKNGAGVHTAFPTRAPTAAPTPADWKCLYAKNTFRPHGWVGRGFGQQYCNRWTCKKGKMIKQNKDCTIAWFGNKASIPKDAQVCSHVKCSESKGKKGLFTVAHHHSEKNGQQHRCAFNKFANSCSCMCWSAKPVYETTVAGRHNFAAKLGFEGTKCEQVMFAGNKQFDPSKGPVRVLTSLSHFAPTPNWDHDAAISWVEYASHTGFKVCARESKKWWHSNDKHDNKMHIEYYAFQEGDINNGLYGAPFAGAQGASAKLGQNWAQGKNNCHTVKFPKAFDAIPMVIGTIDHNDKNNVHDALTFWLENISKEQFKVCFRETLHSDDFHAPIQFNWLSFQHRNPQLWYDEICYMLFHAIVGV
jgi:hypothetical protein